MQSSRARQSAKPMRAHVPQRAATSRRVSATGRSGILGRRYRPWRASVGRCGSACWPVQTNRRKTRVTKQRAQKMCNYIRNASCTIRRMEVCRKNVAKEKHRFGECKNRCKAFWVKAFARFNQVCRPRYLSLTGFDRAGFL